jgi:uncharacterized protein (TIGR02594 family)
MNMEDFFKFGVVEDVDDPLRLGRLRVRYAKIHTDNKTKLPTELLPWSEVMGTINSAAISGVGMAPVGIVPGTMVFSVPLDDGMQQFMVMGTLAGNRTVYINPSYGFNDPSGNYPTQGVNGDVNVMAGGIGGNTGSSSPRTDNTVVNTPIPGSTDPTVPPPVLDPSAYKDTPWMPVAVSQMGINQKDNANVVQQYHLIGGGTMREATVAWCAAFIGWCLAQVNITGTRSASSRSYMSYGNSVGTTNVPYGAIAVFGVPNSGQGHVAFVVEDKGSSIVCIGGNQSDHTASRSGGIVSKSTFPKTGGHLVLLDCRMPTNLNGKP